MKSEVMTRGEATRQMIIERSAPIFMTKGIEATAMSDIMKATMLSKGTLYIHFKNKEELAVATVQYNLDVLRSVIGNAISSPDTIYGKLMAYLDALSDALNTPVEGGCPMMNFGMEADDTNPIIKNEILKAVKSTQNMIFDMINRGIQNGEFKSDWDYIEFGTVFFAVIEGGIMISRIMGSNEKMGVIIKYLRKIIEQNRV